MVASHFFEAVQARDWKAVQIDAAESSKHASYLKNRLKLSNEETETIRGVVASSQSTYPVQ